MLLNTTGYLQNLTGLPLESSATEAQLLHTMDDFLASVEKEAYIIAFAACQDQQTALDIVQDAMFKMVKNYATKPKEQWKPLFYRVLQNRITDQHRKRGLGRLVQWFGPKASDDPDPTEAVDQLPSEAISPDRLTNSMQLNKAVGSALSTLSGQQQQVLMLRLWQGLSVVETANALNLSEGTVKTHLSRAVQQLREQLKEYHT